MWWVEILIFSNSQKSTDRESWRHWYSRIASRESFELTGEKVFWYLWLCSIWSHSLFSTIIEKKKHIISRKMPSQALVEACSAKRIVIPQGEKKGLPLFQLVGVQRWGKPEKGVEVKAQLLHFVNAECEALHPQLKMIGSDCATLSKLSKNFKGAWLANLWDAIVILPVSDFHCCRLL